MYELKMKILRKVA